MIDPEYRYHCVMSHSLVFERQAHWNLLCAEAVELFGLPGQRYVTDLNAEYMTWSFRDPKDAVLFKLKFSEVTC